MPKPWTGNLIGIMHNNEITFQELADELGIAKGYVSQLLNSKREPPGTQERLEGAVERIIQRREGALQ